MHEAEMSCWNCFEFNDQRSKLLVHNNGFALRLTAQPWNSPHSLAQHQYHSISAEIPAYSAAALSSLTQQLVFALENITVRCVRVSVCVWVSVCSSTGVSERACGMEGSYWLPLACIKRRSGKFNQINCEHPPRDRRQDAPAQWDDFWGLSAACFLKFSTKIKQKPKTGRQNASEHLWHHEGKEKHTAAGGEM